MIHFLPFHQIAEELAKKIPIVYAEMNESYDKPNVDWDFYLSLSKSGHCYACVAEDSDIVGFAVYTIGPNPNHKHITEAVNTLLFVEKGSRGKLSFGLIGTAHQKLKALGANEITYLLKDRRIGKLLERMGFKPEYTSWSLRHE